jgi:CubicO group peptidase (beta-lactamase class C family)
MPRYEERICTFWPEFAQGGKETITVRQLLAHQAGLFAFDEVVHKDVVADRERLALVLARQTPAWRPGSRQAYHAISLGVYAGELLRRIDPQHRSLGQFFQDEIATPLGLDFYIRLPEQIPNARLATIESATTLEMLMGAPLKLTLAMFYPGSTANRALAIGAILRDKDGYYFRNLEVPAGGGVGTARAIARAYGVFATGGRELQLRPDTLQLLKAQAIPAERGFYDECLKSEIEFSLGFCKPGRTSSFHPGSFGHPGSGGSFGGADPEAGIGYAYVTNRMGTTLPFDPREVALRNAVWSVIT